MDSHLFPENSPIAQNQGATSSFNFDYENEAGIISSAKIRNAAIVNAKIGTAAIGTANIGTLTFNEISGGTATLGGTSNGNGLMQVLNATGGTVVTINNQGIAVTNGSISIINSAGSTILDPTGLVSTSNFLNGGTVNTSQRNMTGTAYQDIPNTSITTSSFSRNTNILIMMGFQGQFNYGAAWDIDTAFAKLDIDGTVQSSPFYIKTEESCLVTSIDGTAPTFSHYGPIETHTASGITTLGTGTHTLKMKMSVSTYTYNIYDTSLNYIILGS